MQENIMFVNHPCLSANDEAKASAAIVFTNETNVFRQNGWKSMKITGAHSDAHGQYLSSGKRCAMKKRIETQVNKTQTN
jgi:hypothetical protein